MTGRVALLALGVTLSLLAISACTSNSKAPAVTTTTATIEVTTAPTTLPPTTLPPTTTSTSTTTTEPTITTQLVITTTPITTTTASITSPTPLTAQQTTSTVLSPNEQAVRQAIQDYNRAYEECGIAPPTCDPRTFLATEGPALATAIQGFQRMASAGQYFAADSSSRFVPRTVTFESSTKAVLESCLYDGLVLLGPDGLDGKPTVVNDDRVSYLSVHVLYFELGGWRVGEERPFIRLGQGDLCPPA